MTFSVDQNNLLAAPLDSSHVAARTQGGRQVSYIEGWHAIAEANRIFGFDGWNRETVELRQLGEPREVGNNIRVEYSARVRITVGDVVRDGCGFGQGIDKDVGQAHESALKEAETDAMKRAFVTFGNPFGLALYDKTQRNVVEAGPAFITDDQRDMIAKLAEAAGVTLHAICDTLNIKDLREMKAADFASIKKKLNLTIDANIARKEAA